MATWPVRTYELYDRDAILHFTNEFRAMTFHFSFFTATAGTELCPSLFHDFPRRLRMTQSGAVGTDIGTTGAFNAVCLVGNSNFT